MDADTPTANPTAALREELRVVEEQEAFIEVLENRREDLLRRLGERRRVPRRSLARPARLAGGRSSVLTSRCRSGCPWRDPTYAGTDPCTRRA
ncbi:MAG: hypothetical protein JWR70_745 [Modestobacter sp.]|nr:hypothetical protein [Modestobacter sp.]